MTVSGRTTPVHNWRKPLTHSCCAGLQPNRKEALLRLLLYQRQVPEERLMYYSRMQGNDEADVFEMSPRERARYRSHNSNLRLQKGAESRLSFLGLPALKERIVMLQVR